MAKRNSPETDLVRASLEYLGFMRIPAWRNNTGAFEGTNRSGQRRFHKYGLCVGSSDIIGILPDGRFLALEAKIDKNTPTQEQQAFIDLINDSNGVAFAYWSLEELGGELARRMDD